MRLLYLTAHYPPDFTSGATLQVQRTAEAMARAGHDVRVVSGAINAGLADGERLDETTGGVDVRWIGTAERVEQHAEANWRNPPATSAIVEILDSFRPDLVHAQPLQTIGADALTEARRRGIATVVTMHDMWWWCPRLFLVDRDLRPCPVVTATSDCACAAGRDARLRRAATLGAVLDGVDLILVPSNSLRRLVIANGAPADRVEVDENDVDHVALPPATAEPAPAGDGAEVHFVYVGGPSPLKGKDVLLVAAGRLPARGAALTMYGVEPPARRRPRLGRRATVRFAPPYNPKDTAGVLGGADVLVIPSLARESYSLVAREALAHGLAVITSDCLGPTEVVRNGVNGLVVPTGDAGALAAAMTSLVADRGLLAQLREGARGTTVTLRDPTEHAAALAERYVALVARTG